MSGFQHSPRQFMSWPYCGSTDVEQDAHDALERAAECFAPGSRVHPDGTVTPRPRGRPRRRPQTGVGGD